MAIILKENEWAYDMIISCSLGKKPFETLRRVARFYIDEGYSSSEARKKLDSFLLRCDPSVSLPKWSNTLDYAVGKAVKYPSVNIDCVNITDRELIKIDGLDGKQIRRLAFTLLCLAKYWMVVNPKCDYWVNSKDNEIMSLANINTSIKRQGLLYWRLRESGMIQFSKKVDNTNVRVCFAEEGVPVIQIKDYRNLGYQYLMHHGEPYFICSNCGITSKMNNPKVGRKQKYCKHCASEIAMQQRINSVMRQKAGNM